MSTRPDGIDVETAHQYLIEDRAQFIDARPQAEYERSRSIIPGAVHIAPGSGAELAEALRSLPRERTLIAYCDEPGHAASAQVARRARELGRGDASVLEGGFRAWKDAGLPTVENLDATRPGPARPSAPRPDSAGLRLLSAALRPGEPIPFVHTLDGENLSPPLGWEGVPPAARSLVLLMEDLDASGPGGQPFAHWIVYNLQPSSPGLDLGASPAALPAACREGRNDFGRPGYVGPRSPGGLHRYLLRLLALDATLDATTLDRPTREQLLAAVANHVLAEARLEATYERSVEARPAGV